jgi:undecaprenyl-diphosphatase
MVILVAFSRMYLGAHYLSDVLAAFLEAMIWIVLCLTSIHNYRVYHSTKLRQRANN